MARIRVLSPVGTVSVANVAAPPLPTDLTGRTVGFIDNNKANFDRLVQDIGELLVERHGVRRVLHRKKANASTPAPPEILAELAKECDVVFAGSAD
jgi:hypothetical protein